jgi:hypothetical protein
MTKVYGPSDEHPREVTRKRNKNVKKSRKTKIDQEKKRKLRHTRQWKLLKSRLVNERGEIDELTGKKILKEDKLTCHHMRLNPETYGDFSHPEDFMLLSESTHQVLHWLWQLTNGEDFSILDKFRETLKRMKELNDEDSWTGHVSDPHGSSDSGSESESRDNGNGLADIHDYEEVLELQLRMV